MEAKLQPRRHAEVAARAAKAPEEIRVLVRACPNHGAVRSHYLSGHEVVAREAVLCGQVPDPAAESEAGDAGGADDAAWCDEAEGLGRGIEVEPGRAACGACDPRVSVDVDRAHEGEIDHEPAVDDAVPCRIVAAPAHGHLQVLCAGEVEGGCDVAGPEAARDHRRPPIDERIEAA